jgi:tetratricopeptide (TPR) repeat protein
LNISYFQTAIRGASLLGSGCSSWIFSALDENDPFGYVALGRTYTILGKHDAAITAYDTAIALNPSYATAHFGRGHALWHSGRPAEALGYADEAMRLSPRDPMFWAFLASKAIALVMLGRFDEAVDCARKSQQLARGALFSNLPEVSALAWLERPDELRDAMKRLLKIKPDITMRFVGNALPITSEDCRERFFKGLRTAGIPD